MPSGGRKNKRIRSQSPARTVPSASNIDNGYNAINYYLRSILIHPIGLLLASFLNEVKLSTILSNIWTTFSNQEGWCTYNNRTRSSRFRDEILSSAMYE